MQKNEQNFVEARLGNYLDGISQAPETWPVSIAESNIKDSATSMYIICMSRTTITWPRIGSYCCARHAMNLSMPSIVVRSLQTSICLDEVTKLLCIGYHHHRHPSGDRYPNTTTWVPPPYWESRSTHRSIQGMYGPRHRPYAVPYSSTHSQCRAYGGVVFGEDIRYFVFHLIPLLLSSNSARPDATI